MKRLPSTGFNKEKLIFIGASALLSFSLYHMLTSAPVVLVPGAPVSTLAAPGPLDREKADTRVANVLYYIEGGVNPMAGVAVARDRKNPFEPIDEFIDQKPVVVVDKNIKNKGNGPNIEPPPEQPVAEEKPVEKEKKKYEASGPKVAKVDFSGVMTMNGVTYGLLKSKDGQTIQVKEGDYLDDFQYTVSKIEKQAIFVSDEENNMFVARDLTFDEGGGGGGAGGDGEDKPKKKPAKKEGKKDLTAAPAAPVAAAPQQPQRPQNNNKGGNQRGGAGGNMRGGRGGGTGGNMGKGGGGF